MSATVSATLSSFIRSTRWSKITLRWSFWTLSNFEQVLADVEVARLDLLLRLLQRLVDPGMDDGLALFQAEPLSMVSSRSEPKIRIRSSSSDRKNFERPGSP